MAMVALRATATFGESRPPEKTRRATLGGYATPFANWLTSPSIPLRSSDALIHCWPLPSALGFSGGRLSPKVAVSFAETDHRHTACVGQPKRWNCVKALLAVLCSGRHSANGYGRSSSDRDFRRKSPTRKNPPSNTRRAYATPFAKHSLHRHNPDVAIHNRVAVVLELEGAGRGGFFLTAGAFLRELNVVVNLHAVVIDRRAAVLRLLAIRAELGGRELDVVGLPHHWREAHIHERFVLRVDPTALVVFTLQAEAIENLTFVAVLNVHAAISALLTGAVGHPRQAEFDVRLERAELLLARFTDTHELAVGEFHDLRPVPLLDVVGFAEQHDRSFRRLFAKRLGFPFNLAQGGVHLVVRVSENHPPLRPLVDNAEPAFPIRGRRIESQLLPLTRCDAGERWLAVPASAGQATRVHLQVELSFALRNHLHADLFLLAKNGPLVFTLDCKVGVFRGVLRLRDRNSFLLFGFIVLSDRTGHPDGKYQTGGEQAGNEWT